MCEKKFKVRIAVQTTGNRVRYRKTIVSPMYEKQLYTGPELHVAETNGNLTVASANVRTEQSSARSSASENTICSPEGFRLSELPDKTVYHRIDTGRGVSRNEHYTRARSFRSRGVNSRMSESAGPAASPGVARYQGAISTGGGMCSIPRRK